VKQISNAEYRRILKSIEIGEMRSVPFESIGVGCGRRVYKVLIKGCEPFVLKVAKDMRTDRLDGRSQNEVEIKTYEKSCHLASNLQKYVPRIFDWDTKKFTWVEVELLATPSDQVLWPSKYIRKQLCQELNMVSFELERQDHWGLNSRGVPKMLDMGIVGL